MLIKDIEKIAEEIGKITAEKNIAYGSAFDKTGDFLKILFPDGIALEKYRDVGLLVRIFDKMMRIANRKNAFGENPYRDIAGYGLCGVLEEDRANEPPPVSDLSKGFILPDSPGRIIKSQDGTTYPDPEWAVKIGEGKEKK